MKKNERMEAKKATSDFGLLLLVAVAMSSSGMDISCCLLTNYRKVRRRRREAEEGIRDRCVKKSG